MSYTETWSGKINRKLIKKLHIINVAAGREKADLVLKNATFVNVFSGELGTCDIAVAEGSPSRVPSSVELRYTGVLPEPPSELTSAAKEARDIAEVIQSARARAINFFI